MIKGFPPIETASPDGLLAIGGDLEIGSLRLAYENGIFPWPTEGYPLLWFAPPQRAILEFKDLRVPKRLQRELKKQKFHYKMDQDFESVIRKCAEGKTRSSQGTWITDEMIAAYLKFHRVGNAHSFECYNENKQLVGGLYGVGIEKYFAGESMFFLEKNASKAALLYACRHLQSRGITWLDVQVISPLLTSFGAKEIPRSDFMSRLRKALRR